MAKVSSRCASYEGGSAGTTKISSPPRRGLSWPAAGPAVAASSSAVSPALINVAGSLLDMKGDFERVAHPVHVRVERVVDLVELEMVADEGVGDELARAHERQRP